MTARQTRQHFRTGQLGMPAAGRSCVDEADQATAFDYDRHNNVLQHLVGARDPSMLEQKEPAVVQLEQACVTVAMEDCTPSNDKFTHLLYDTPFLELCMRAVSNSMTITLQHSKGSMLDRREALDVVSSLCFVIGIFIKQASQSQRRFQDVREHVHSHINASGLMPALCSFTEAAWQALQQLDLSNCQQQCAHAKPPTRSQQRQQRLRHDTLAKRCGTAAETIHQLLVLWHEILAREQADPNVANSPVIPAAAETLPALTSLTTTAVLRGARDCIASSSNTNIAKYDYLVKSIAARGLVAARVVAFMHGPWKDKTKQEQLQYLQLQPGQQQHYLLIGKLPELLLHLLARQAGQLHAACGGVSLALQDSRAAAATSAHQSQQDQQHPQQQQPQWNQQQELLRGFVVPSSHQSLLELVGVGHSEYLDILDPAVGVPRLTCLYSMTCSVLASVIRTRLWRATLLSKMLQGANHQQEPQQQQAVDGDSHIVLPWNLLVPAIKVLIEVVLLLPVKALTVHAHSIRLIMLLLHTSASPARTAAAAPPSPEAGGAGAAVVEEKGPQVAMTESPWLQLPAAVAAGLLQPVVCQLAQAVVYSLLQTEDVQSEDAKMKANRLMLLHSYGSLLIIVCQSVEFKHVGAVLRSQKAADLLITLAAVEAVIRAQASHLAPEQCLQQLQQQEQHQQHAVDVTSSSSFDVLTDITQHPLSEAPLLLLPFVSDFTRALDSVINKPGSQEHVEALLAGSSSAVVDKLSARLVTLLNTVLKVSRCAVARAAAVEAEIAAIVAAGPAKVAPATAFAASGQLKCACALTMANAVMTTTLANRWFAVTSNTSSRMKDSCGSSKVPAMPVVLVFRALQAWTCAWESWATSHEVPAAASSPQGVGSTKSITSLLPLKTIMSAAIDIVQLVLERLAAEAQVVQLLATRSADDGLRDPQQRVHDAACDLHMLLQRARQVEECLRTTMQIAITEAGTSNPSEAAADCLSSKSNAELSDSLARIGVVHPSTAVLMSLNQLAAIMQELADAALSCFSSPIICNNPTCVNLTKLSEWQLVCGKACVCAGCELARYCSRSCQGHHWKLHKPTCR